MFKKEDFEMDKIKQQLNEAPIPTNIDNYIKAGIRQGKSKKHGHKRGRIYFTLATSLLIMLFVVSIRVSPVFAAYVSQIPGLENIVKLITYDKGLQLAVENEFIQHIGLSNEHEGIKLTVDDIIIDETRMIVFYTIENNNNHEQKINLSRLEFLDENNKKLEIGYGFDGIIDSIGVNETVNQKIDVSFPKNYQIPDVIYLSTKMWKGNPPNEAESEAIWKIAIPVDKTKFEGMKEVYALNEIVEVEGQKIIFKTATVYPTKIAVEVEYDANNTKKIFSFDDLRIVDENGEEFSIPNGLIASQTSENTETLYLQSNYFNKPKKLYIRANSFKALDKNKLDVIVDLDKGELITSPDDSLQLDRIQRSNNNIGIYFMLQKEAIDEYQQYSIFAHDFNDSSGQSFHAITVESWDDNENKNEYNQGIKFNIVNEEYQNPIILEIERYPTRIYGDINIRVK